MAGARYGFILGAPNADDGTLSAISLGRIGAAARLHRDDPAVRLIPTGGHGAHFNRAPRPHRQYVEQALAARGIPILSVGNDTLLSANTVEDAVQIAGFAKGLGVAAFAVVTSAFHAARCRFVFGALCPAWHVTLHLAPDPLDIDPSLIAHEARALATLKSQRGVMVDGALYPVVRQPDCITLPA